MSKLSNHIFLQTFRFIPSFCFQLQSNDPCPVLDCTAQEAALSCLEDDRMSSLTMVDGRECEGCMICDGDGDYDSECRCSITEISIYTCVPSLLITHSPNPFLSPLLSLSISLSRTVLSSHYLPHSLSHAHTHTLSLLDIQ